MQYNILPRNKSIRHFLKPEPSFPKPELPFLKPKPTVIRK